MKHQRAISTPRSSPRKKREEPFSQKIICLCNDVKKLEVSETEDIVGTAGIYTKIRSEGTPVQDFSSSFPCLKAL